MCLETDKNSKQISEFLQMNLHLWQFLKKQNFYYLVVSVNADFGGTSFLHVSAPIWRAAFPLRRSIRLGTCILVVQDI